MNESVIICTYSQYNRLFKICKEFTTMLPFRHISLHNWRHRYCIADLLTIKADWVIHIDEDAFIFNPNSLQKIIDFMEKNDFHCAGMPDGGVIPHRTYNPLACNPFFLVLNRKKIILNGIPNIEEIVNATLDDKLFQYTPSWLNKNSIPYEYCEFEPFYGFFFWLLQKKMNILYLKAYQTNFPGDDISTILLDCDETPFLAHSWYSREFLQESKCLGLRILRRILNRRKIGLLQKNGLHYNRIMKLVNWAHENREL